MIKLKKKEILAYTLVFVLVLILYFLFFQIFAFEKDEKKEDLETYPEITNELIQELYSYIPDHNRYYVGYKHLMGDVRQIPVYNYILKYNNKILGTITIDDLRNNNIIAPNEGEGEYVPLYKISQKDFEKNMEILYGKVDNYYHRSFSINSNTKAYYIENVGYLIYQKGLANERYITDATYEKYAITDSGATLLIYDRYAMCDVTTNECFGDRRGEGGKLAGVSISDGKIVGNKDSKKEYVHKYKFADGKYYWYSTEQVK